MIGAFVTVDSSERPVDNSPLGIARLGSDGIGRLVGVKGSTATVEYFVSPAGPKFERKLVEKRHVRRLILWAETPVFWFDENAGNWRRGRITSAEGREAESGQELYRVRFPNNDDGLLSGEELQVRWAHPIEDPVEYLAARVTDTPFFLEGRRRMIGWLAKQRAAFGGLTGLASASIDLHRHQVEIVRQVLADPVQRYLLADEVGLGKTIEAYCVIRQHLIDEPSRALVTIVVPDHLARQWLEELSRRFGIDNSDLRVKVIRESDLTVDATESRKPTLLVVDEAHRFASGAFSSEDPRMSDLYASLEKLATEAPRVLLLSGTPVLHQEDGFLAMLHLLDPGAYPLDDREGFRHRVRNRSAVADAVAQLVDDAPATFLEDAVEQLELAFGGDLALQALTGEVARLAEYDESNLARVGAIRALRAHVTEAYKLHRRLLRTRRDDPSVQHLLAVRKGVERLTCDDLARRLTWDCVEEWRCALPIDGEGRPPAEAVPLFAEFVEAAFSHPSAFVNCVRARIKALGGASTSSMHAAVWLGELHWCARAIALLEQVAGSEPRADKLAEWLAASEEKAVVFVDSPDVAIRVSAVLRKALGSACVLQIGQSLSGNEPDPVSRFITDSGVRVIVADRHSEEGLNLQGARAVLIHYDLPFAPTRIEQRNGRIDRLNAMGAPRFLAFEGASPYELAWAGLLEDQVQLFSRTVAPLQYLLAESCQRLRGHLVSHGVHAFAVEAKRLDGPGGLEDELTVIRHQEALDSLTLSTEVNDGFFSTMCDRDEEASETNGADCEEWLCRRLQFARPRVRRIEPVLEFHYEYALDSRPLLPLHAAVTNLAQSIDAHASRAKVLKFGSFTYDRECAVEHAGVHLLRPGSPFLDGIERLIRCDDRGAAFAMWRYDPRIRAGATYLFFRVEFFIEVDVAEAQAALDDEASSAPEALRRLADAAFEPTTLHVWVDVKGRRVSSKQWLTLLDRPYQQPNDQNLRTDRWAVADKACPVNDWRGLCRNARDAAQEALWDDTFRRTHAEVLGRLEESQTSHRVQWASRITRMPEGPSRHAESMAAQLSERLDVCLLAGLRRPSVRVDSMGAVYLSSKPLEDW